MAEAKRDQNRVPTLLGTSNVDGITPVVLWADPTTHRLLVDLPASMSDPMTTRGDIIVRNASNVTARLGIGTNGQVLTSNGTDISWGSAGTGDVVGPASAVDGQATVFNGTTGKLVKTFVPTLGSIIFAGTSGVLSQDNATLFFDNTNKQLGVGANSFLATGNIINAKSTSIASAQTNVQNASNGNSASSDHVATADTGTNTTNFIDLGINSSTYNDAGFTITGALDGYLYTSDSHLAIGTAAATKTIKFHTGGTLAANLRATISDTALNLSTGVGFQINSVDIKDIASVFTNKTFDTAGTGNVLKINTYQVSDKTGTGKVVLDTTPTLVTPVLGVATATSINKMAITAPATSSTLAVADGKTFTASNSLTLAGTDSTTMTFPSTSSTVMTLASADTIAGVKTFNDGSVKLSGATSGASTLKAPAIASTYVHTLPAMTTTLASVGSTTETSNTATVVAIAGIHHTHTITALAAANTFGVPTVATGALDDTCQLIIRIKDNGTARALSWNAVFRASSDLALPTTTILSKTLYLGFKYNVADTKWDLLALLNNF